MIIKRGLVTVIVLMISALVLNSGYLVDSADARSFKGGRMFKSTPTHKKSVSQQKQTTASSQKQGGFKSGLAGGLLGGAIGGMLFGSLFGMGGQGLGLLPILLLAGGAYFLFRTRVRKPQMHGAPASHGPPGQSSVFTNFDIGGGQQSEPPPPPPLDLVEDGLAQIKKSDPGFDEKYFIEVASDVFFKIQAGWMRRDISSYRNLLGDQLAAEYEKHFQEMEEKGHINKLESIGIRKIEISGAGSDDREDHLTVLFTANLLDYIVDDETGALVSGSMTEPVKFSEKWTWARPLGTEDWRLEGIDVVNEW